MNKENIDPSSGQFIDPLFAIVIGGALNETLIAWVKAGTYPDSTQLGVVVLGFVNLLLSWYGYHKSVQKKPILGVLRFSVTIILLPLYLLSIVLYSKPILYVALVYAGIFFAWGIWEWLRSLEYSTNLKLLKILFYKWNLIIYLSLAIQFLNGTLIGNYYPDWVKNNINGTTLVLIFIAIFYLRIIKSMSHDESPASKLALVLREWLINPATTSSSSKKEDQ